MQKNILRKAAMLLTAVIIAGAFFVSPSYAAPESINDAKILNVHKDAATPTDDIRLIPGGDIFGLSIKTEGVMVTDISEVNSDGKILKPAETAGLKKGDIIIEADGKKVDSNAQIKKIIASSCGNVIKFKVQRGSECILINLTPIRADDDNEYKAGIAIRDSMSGIGTVTYIHPDNMTFGALGHGICDSETNTLLPMKKGITSPVTLSGVVKGKENCPGELHGNFTAVRNGALYSNTNNGIFGIFNELPDKSSSNPSSKAIPIMKKCDVKEGKASVICTVCTDENGNNAKKEYEIKISKIDTEKSGCKNFIVEVTDKELLDITGGIVQGMSGSPIIQDGKLVGAVTHVLINDPTKGYGIFIENMLEAAQIPIAMAS